MVSEEIMENLHFLGHVTIWGPFLIVEKKSNSTSKSVLNTLGNQITPHIIRFDFYSIATAKMAEFGWIFSSFWN